MLVNVSYYISEGYFPSLSYERARICSALPLKWHFRTFVSRSSSSSSEEERRDGSEDQNAAFILIKKTLNTETLYKNNKRNNNREANANCAETSNQHGQSPTNKQCNPGYLSMILNQRQLMTPASD